MSAELNAFTLFSSSKGNCTYIRCGETELLIDAGASARAINRALKELGSSLERIKGIFITHEHADHINGLETVSKYFSIPVYAPFLCCRSIRTRCPSSAPFLVPFEHGACLSAGDIELVPFATPHDSEDSVCYRISAGKYSLGYATDIGHLTAEIGRCVLGCDAVVIESNHDIEMLKNGSYPYMLKKRILGEYGHLSNKSCSNALPRLVESGVRRIVLAHLSPENNRPAIALGESCGALAAKSVKVSCDGDGNADVVLSVAPQCGTLRII